jgi:hypothetical protein
MGPEPVRRGLGRPWLPQRLLTAPETVAVSPDQYRKAADLLASMIQNYYHAHMTEQLRSRPPTLG